MRTRRRVLRRVIWGLVVLVVLTVGGTLIWSQVGVMDAEDEPLAEARANPSITIDDAPEGIVLSPADGGSEAGLVFIPGAKVDPWAYVPVLQDVAASRVTVVITRPWLDLAFFDLRGPDAFTSAVPEVESWGVGGHSLGGVRACMLASQADALVLFASYCAGEVPDDLAVLSLAGSKDGLSTPENVSEARGLLPTDAVMIEIAGASHASFGAYGPSPATANRRSPTPSCVPR
ncbi:alpha/beta hydrolase [Microbacterium sp. GXF6406]